MLANDPNLIEEHRRVGRSIFRTMLFIRRVEERFASEYHKQKMRCPMHLCIGQEAVAVAVSQCLSVKDEVFSGHRAHRQRIRSVNGMSTVTGRRESSLLA